MRILLLAGIILLFTAAAAETTDAAQIIQRSVAALNHDWEAEQQFDYSETEKDKDGTKTYQVTMLFGSPYSRLVQINGTPLTFDRQSEEDKKFTDAVLQRQHESVEERSQRISKYEAERKRNHTLMNQLAVAFHFQLTGSGSLNGHRVYILQATPRKEYQPIDRDTKALTGMQGTLWIDQDTFQWVKVEAHVMRPVSIEGFLATVEPGTRFELEKTPVTNDVWLRKHFSMKSNAKVLLFFSRKSQEDDSYFNYHRRR